MDTELLQELSRQNRHDVWLDRSGRPWKWFGNFIRGQWKVGQHHIDPDDLFGCGYWVWSISRVGGRVEENPSYHGPFHRGYPDECLDGHHRPKCCYASKSEPQLT